MRGDIQTFGEYRDAALAYFNVNPASVQRDAERKAERVQRAGKRIVETVKQEVRE